MPDTSTNISTVPLIRTASRLFAAFLLFWVTTEIAVLPREIFNLVHDLQDASRFGGQATGASYAVQYMVLGLVTSLVYIAILLVAAGWFYRCGPRIRRYFSPETETPLLD